jgi:hypothetical protein
MKVKVYGGWRMEDGGGRMEDVPFSFLLPPLSP